MPDLVPIQIDFRDVSAQRKKNLTPKTSKFGVHVSATPDLVQGTEDWFDQMVKRPPLGAPKMKQGRLVASGPFGQATDEERSTQSPFWSEQRKTPGTLAHAMHLIDTYAAPQGRQRAAIKRSLEQDGEITAESLYQMLASAGAPMSYEDFIAASGFRTPREEVARSLPSLPETLGLSKTGPETGVGGAMMGAARGLSAMVSPKEVFGFGGMVADTATGLMKPGADLSLAAQGTPVGQMVTTTADAAGKGAMDAGDIAELTSQFAVPFAVKGARSLRGKLKARPKPEPSFTETADALSKGATLEELTQFVPEATPPVVAPTPSPSTRKGLRGKPVIQEQTGVPGTVRKGLRASPVETPTPQAGSIPAASTKPLLQEPPKPETAKPVISESGIGAQEPTVAKSATVEPAVSAEAGTTYTIKNLGKKGFQVIDAETDAPIGKPHATKEKAQKAIRRAKGEPEPTKETKQLVPEQPVTPFLESNRQPTPTEAGPSFKDAPSLPERTVATPKFEMKVRVVPKLVDRADVIPSHDRFGNQDPRFPHELGGQGRDRSSAAYQDLILEAAQKPIPDEWNQQFPTVDHGWPVVDKRGVTAAGTGRFQIDDTMRDLYPDKHAAKQKDIAKQFGLDDIPKDKVAVFEIQDDLTPQQLKEFNEYSDLRVSADKGAGEKAVNDWEHLPKDWMTRLDASGGDLEAMFSRSGNKALVDEFMNHVPKADQVGLRNSDGTWTEAAYERVANAALGDMLGKEAHGILKSAVEGSIGQRLIKGFQQSVGQLAWLAEAGKRGDEMAKEFHNAIGPALAYADEYSKQSAFKKPAEFFKQGGFGLAERDPLAVQLATELIKAKSQKQAAGLIGGVADDIRSQQEGMGAMLYGEKELPDLIAERAKTETAGRKGLKSAPKTAGAVDLKTLGKLSVPVAAGVLAYNLDDRQEAKIIAALGAGGLALATMLYTPAIMRSRFGSFVKGQEGVLAEKSPTAKQNFAEMLAVATSTPRAFLRGKGGYFGGKGEMALNAGSRTLRRTSADLHNPNGTGIIDSIEKHFGKDAFKGRVWKKKTAPALNALGEKMRQNMRSFWNQEAQRVEYTPQEQAFLDDVARTRDKYHAEMWEAGGGVAPQERFRARLPKEKAADYRAAKAKHEMSIFKLEMKKGIVTERAPVEAVMRSLDDPTAQAEKVKGVVIGARTGGESVSAQITDMANALRETYPDLTATEARAQAKEWMRLNDPFSTIPDDGPHFIVRGEDGGTYRLDVGQHYIRRGLSFYGRDYFPQIFKQEFLLNLRDKKIQEEWAAKLVERSPERFPTHEMALEYLGDLAEQAYGDTNVRSFMGNLETPAHGVLLPEAMETDWLTAMNKYVYRANKRIAIAEYFGADPSSIDTTLQFMTPRQQEYFQNVLGAALNIGPKAERGAAHAVASLDSAYQAGTKLTGGTTHLAQANDLFYNLTAGRKDFFKGALEAVNVRFRGKASETSEAIYDVAKKRNWSAYAEGPQNVEKPGGSGPLERAANRLHLITNSVMNAIQLGELDRDIKTVNVAVAIRDAETTANALMNAGKRKGLKAVGSDKASLRRKLKLGFGFSDADVAIIERQGFEAVRTNERLKDVFYDGIKQRRMYSGRPQDFPMWMSTPLGSMMTRFKKPMVTATRFFFQDVVSEAMHGNVRPLANMLVIGGIGGTAIKEIRDLIKNRADEDSVIRRLLEHDVIGAVHQFMDGFGDALGSSGVTGVMYDLNPAINPSLDSLTPKDYLTRLALPPAATSALSGADAGRALAKYLQTDKEEDPHAYARAVESIKKAWQQDWIALRRAEDWTGFSAPTELLKVPAFGDLPTLESIDKVKRLNQLERKTDQVRAYNRRRGLTKPRDPGFRDLTTEETKELRGLRRKYKKPAPEPIRLRGSRRTRGLSTGGDF